MTPLGRDVDIGGEIDVLDGGGGDGQGVVGLRVGRGVWHDIPVGDGGGEADVGEGYVEKDVVAVVEEEPFYYHFHKKKKFDRQSSQSNDRFIL